MLSSDKIIEAVKDYDPHVDEDQLRHAYLFAMEAHGSQQRASGIPYFAHPVEVAAILIDLKCDHVMVIAGLLHDVVEDTQISIDRIESMFGEDVASIVDGVTKISKVSYKANNEYQSDNFRRFLMAISSDVRVLIVKLADRLHNMRTLHAINDKDKRRRIALETLEVFSPLAERIGMQKIKDELDDRAFFALYPDEYNAISVKLNQLKCKDVDFIKNVIQSITECLQKNDVAGYVIGREKRHCSIWRKMRRQNISISQLNDIMAFRIIVNNINDCYRALGVVHVMYPIVPGRFKDYISAPKLNGYKSLHTTVVGPFKQKIEVQIRTSDMHNDAENGLAAHWSYKDGAVNATNGKNYKWLNNLISVLENTIQQGDNTAQADMDIPTKPGDIFCFSPAGDIVQLPANSSCVDFAYYVHSSVGNRCIAAKVNGKIVPLKTALRNGDQVEIMTSNNAKPDASWINFVISNKAKSCIKRFIKVQSKEDFFKLGKMIVEHVFEEYGVVFSERKILLNKFNATSIDMFYRRIARMEIHLQNLRRFVMRLEKTKRPHIGEISIANLMSGVAIHFCECCAPMPNEPIVGILTPRVGLLVHSKGCNVVKISKEALFNITWNNANENSSKSFIARLKLTILNKIGSFARVFATISDHNADVTNVKIESRSQTFYDVIIDVEVNDIQHLSEVQSAITSCKRVRAIQRMQNS